MNKSIIIWIVVILVVLGGIWWWMSRSGNQAVAPSSPAGQSAATPADTVPTPATVLDVRQDPILGTYLVAANGMTLYQFAKDVPSTSNCYDACATNWPPYTVPAEILKGGPGVVGNIGMITRKEGTFQVAYNRTPLYFWSKDGKPGDATGQNFGGVWSVVKP